MPLRYEGMQRGIVRALKSIFGLQTSDAQDLDFLKVVQPVWNVEPLIAGRGDYLWITGTQAAPAASEDVITFTVPTNEEWHVAFTGAQKPTTVGVVAPPWPVIRNAASALAAGLGYGLMPPSAADRSTRHSQGIFMSPPLVLGPGESLIWRWYNPDAGALTFHAGVLRRVITLSG